MKNILWQSLRSGTLASLAMMPFGLVVVWALRPSSCTTKHR